MTTKDYSRMETLRTYYRDHGLCKAIQKAERDADKIETPEKARSRADILEGWNLRALAVPFRNRVKYLNASGIY